MTTVYVGVGSNIEPTRHIPVALDALTGEGITVTATSRFYRTDPIGRPDQEPYANGVWQLEYAQSALRLRSLLKQIESRLGRVRTTDKYAARSIDLDILLFGDAIIDEEDLVVPDPHILKRPFLSACLLEIDPGIHLPGTEGTLRDLVGGLPRLEDYPEITSIIRTKLERKDESQTRRGARSRAVDRDRRRPQS